MRPNKRIKKSIATVKFEPETIKAVEEIFDIPEKLEEKKENVFEKLEEKKENVFEKLEEKFNEMKEIINIQQPNIEIYQPEPLQRQCCYIM